MPAEKSVALADPPSRIPVGPAPEPVPAGRRTAADTTEGSSRWLVWAWVGSGAVTVLICAALLWLFEGPGGGIQMAADAAGKTNLGTPGAAKLSPKTNGQSPGHKTARAQAADRARPPAAPSAGVEANTTPMRTEPAAILEKLRQKSRLCATATPSRKEFLDRIGFGNEEIKAALQRLNKYPLDFKEFFTFYPQKCDFLFNGGSLRMDAYRRSVARLNSIPLEEFSKWQHTLSDDLSVSSPHWCIAVTLCVVDELFGGSNQYDEASGTKYRRRLAGIRYEDIAACREPLANDRRDEIALAIALVDELFPNEAFDRDMFRKALGITGGPDAEGRGPAPPGRAKQPERTPTVPETTPGKSTSGLRQVPLLVQRTHLPDFANEGVRDPPDTRLNVASPWEPDDDTAVAVRGAKQAAQAAGFEFEPVRVLQINEKPRDVVASLSKDSDVFLLVRISTRTAEIRTLSLLSVLADAALYRRADLKPLFSRGFLGVEKLQSTEMSREEWTRRAANLFSQEFREEVLPRMQRSQQGDGPPMDLRKSNGAGPLLGSLHS